MNRRLDLGLFQRDVAHEIEVDTETVYRWESNESTPQIQFFSAIIKFLNLTITHFRCRDPARGWFSIVRRLV